MPCWSTELEVDAAGTCTGRMLGGNCRGAERRRLRAYLQSDDVEVWAYGDAQATPNCWRWPITR
jgi:phosphoserine phosphatase